MHTSETGTEKVFTQAATHELFSFVPLDITTQISPAITENIQDDRYSLTTNGRLTFASEAIQTTTSPFTFISLVTTIPYKLESTSFSALTERNSITNMQLSTEEVLRESTSQTSTTETVVTSSLPLVDNHRALTTQHDVKILSSVNETDTLTSVPKTAEEVFTFVPLKITSVKTNEATTQTLSEMNRATESSYFTESYSTNAMFKHDNYSELFSKDPRNSSQASTETTKFTPTERSNDDGINRVLTTETFNDSFSTTSVVTLESTLNLLLMSTIRVTSEDVVTTSRQTVEEISTDADDNSSTVTANYSFTAVPPISSESPKIETYSKNNSHGKHQVTENENETDQSTENTTEVTFTEDIFTDPFLNSTEIVQTTNENKFLQDRNESKIVKRKQRLRHFFYYYFITAIKANESRAKDMNQTNEQETNEHFMGLPGDQSVLGTKLLLFVKCGFDALS